MENYCAFLQGVNHYFCRTLNSKLHKNKKKLAEKRQSHRSHKITKSKKKQKKLIKSLENYVIFGIKNSCTPPQNPEC